MKELKYYINALCLSLFSRKFYAELITSKSIYGIKYLFLISIIVAAPVAAEVKYIISNIFSSEVSGTDENIDYILKQVPEINIQDGKITTPLTSNQSVVSKSGDVLAIFDVENKIDDLDGYDKVLVINEHGIRFKMPNEAGTAVLMASEIEKAMEQYSSSTDNGRKFDMIRLFTDIRHILKTPYIIIVIVVTFWFLAGYLFSALGYSFVVGVLFSIMCKNKTFDFMQCFRVAAFTITPIALFDLLSALSGGLLFSHTSLVYFITHIVYIHFAIESYRKLRK